MTANAPILSAESLAKRFGSRLVLDDVSFSLRQGDLLAIVGESGSGKSTLLRCLAMLEQPDDGLVRFHGQPVHALLRTRTTDFRRRVQLVMQDAAMAMNPAWQALRIVREPLDILRRDLSISQRDEMAVASLQHVGLDASFVSRFPRELSGGQRQRLQIARALSLQPELLLLDEPFAGLDTPVQADLLALLQQLRRTRALTCVIVTHDLELACWASTALLLLHRGRLLRHIPAPANPAFTNFRQRAAAYSDYAAFLDDLVERTKNPPQGISNAEDQAP